MSLDVIGAGFGRTGTLSLKIALERLGYDKCHHMKEVFLHGDQSIYWSDISKGGHPEWDKVFRGYKATTDFPGCIFYRELAQYFPEAKVILTVRDEDGWYRSVRDTIWQLSNTLPKWLLAIAPPLRRRTEMIHRLIWGRVFDHRIEDEAYAKLVFRQHNQQVQSHIPAERLLVYQIAEGWGPLCKFLGCEEPQEPFPRSNDSTAMKRVIVGVRALNWLPAVFLALVLLALGLIY